MTRAEQIRAQAWNDYVRERAVLEALAAGEATLAVLAARAFGRARLRLTERRALAALVDSGRVVRKSVRGALVLRRVASCRECARPMTPRHACDEREARRA